MSKQGVDSNSFKLITSLNPLGGDIRLKGLSKTEYNDKFFPVYGIEYNKNKGLMYKICVSECTGATTFDSKHIKVSHDKIECVKYNPYNSFIDFFLIDALTSAGLNPSELVSPIFLADQTFCNGYQDWNVGHYAKKYGLIPVFGYIISPKTDASGRYEGGIQAYNTFGFYKNDVIYVPVEHEVLCTVPHSGGSRSLFIPDVRLSPNVLEKLHVACNIFFPWRVTDAGNILISPFRTTPIENKNAFHLNLWQTSQHIPIASVEDPRNTCKDYLEMHTSACVIDHSLALAVNKYPGGLVQIPSRDYEVTGDEEFYFSSRRAFGSEDDPMSLAKECCHCHCISLDYKMIRSKGVTNAFCSEACFRVKKLGGVNATSYAASDPKFKKLISFYDFDFVPRTITELIKKEILNKDINYNNDDGVPMDLSGPLMQKVKKVPQIDYQQTNTSGKVTSKSELRAQLLREQEEDRIKAREKYEADRADAIARYNERDNIAAEENRLAEIEKRIRVLKSRAEASEKKRIKTEQRIANAALGRNRPSGKKDKVKARKEVDDETLENHEQWITPEAREARMVEGELKKQLAHSEAEARKIKAAIDAKRAGQAEIGKQQAAREHKLPEPLTMADALEAATVAKAISASVAEASA
jgi:hypothetical protein